MSNNQLLYFFGGGKAEGTAAMKNLLGGKGANVAEMTNLGIPVPPGFTITTEVCTGYYANGNKWPDKLEQMVRAAVIRMEKLLTKGFGSTDDPLLVSVRSGARVSMPGMMDTVLNLGLNAETVRGLAKRSGNERFAYDSYRRFIQMYGSVVLGLSHDDFEHVLEAEKVKAGVKTDSDLDTPALQSVVEGYKSVVRTKLGREFPDDVWQQLIGAVNAVFASWNNRRAIDYRRINGIPGDWGTAVTVQAMVFGNTGSDSATGVAFTRDPSSGDDRIVGEYLINAQGEDVVAGIRTPQQITEDHRIRENSTLASMEASMSHLYQELALVMKKLEKHYRHPQDVEFTVQSGKLFLLQTRNAKRTAQAGLRWAVDMQTEGALTPEEAIERVTPEDVERLFHPFVDPKAEAKAKEKTLGKGLAGSPGAYSGRVVFDPDSAVAWTNRGEKVILVRKETSPDDIHGMHASLGFLTAVGGMTSHAVLVARQMGKTCVAGCGEAVLRVDYQRKIAHVGSKVIKEGDWITLDGNVGRFIEGVIPTVAPKPDERFNTYMAWVDGVRRLRVRANADTPDQAKRARDLGAEGIGLCRTEHMFFGADRIGIVKDMILHLHDAEHRKASLAKLLPLQKADFLGLFKAMEGLPVTIRLLDPPLHEFLDKEIDMARELATLKASGGDVDRIVELETVLRTQESLHEFNPMLGHRGCRLAITYPDMYEMQVQAIMEAACELRQEGSSVVPEIMIPLVGHVKELEITRRSAEKIAGEVMARYGLKFEYHIGTMIEVPRAALTADEIARCADFFSFGTNDLTQMTFGFSRDDIGKFLPAYLTGLDEKRDGRKQEHIFEKDPFVAIDQAGVGQLMRTAVALGRKTRDKLKIGICGEHGGEPSSVIFCHDLGLDYVSCSPLRVPVARSAAAHAALLQKKADATKAEAAKLAAAMAATIAAAAPRAAVVAPTPVAESPAPRVTAPARKAPKAAPEKAPAKQAAPERERPAPRKKAELPPPRPASRPAVQPTASRRSAVSAPSRKTEAERGRKPAARATVERPKARPVKSEKAQKATRRGATERKAVSLPAGRTNGRGKKAVAAGRASRVQADTRSRSNVKATTKKAVASRSTGRGTEKKSTNGKVGRRNGRGR